MEAMVQAMQFRQEGAALILGLLVLLFVVDQLNRNKDSIKVYRKKPE